MEECVANCCGLMSYLHFSVCVYLYVKGDFAIRVLKENKDREVHMLGLKSAVLLPSDLLVVF